jgi:hypothetical protein
VTDLCVIVPTRSRPGNASRLARAFAETGATADLVFGVDLDDEDGNLAGYLTAAACYDGASVDARGRTTMAGTLNAIAAELAMEYGALGFMGDDHLPRTKDWDQHVVRALQARPGLAYGDDLVHGRGLSTHIFMSSSVVMALGYMSPPAMGHLFIDNFWTELGTRARCLTYLPDVVVEHMHPLVGKAERDEGYARVNAPETWRRDEEAYEEWKAGRAYADVHTTREVTRRG